MNRTVQIGVIAFIVVVVGILIYAAASGSIFFANQELTPDTVVYVEEDGFAFPFYKDGTATKAVTVFHSVGEEDSGLVPVLFQVIPKEGYRIDSLYLEINPLQPASALLLEETDYEYQRADSDSKVVLSFHDLDSQPSETITLDFQVDMSLLDASTPEELFLYIALTMHEDSVFKLVSYDADITINLVIPSAA